MVGDPGESSRSSPLHGDGELKRCARFLLLLVLPKRDRVGRGRAPARPVCRSACATSKARSAQFTVIWQRRATLGGQGRVAASQRSCLRASPASSRECRASSIAPSRRRSRTETGRGPARWQPATQLPPDEVSQAPSQPRPRRRRNGSSRSAAEKPRVLVAPFA